MRVVCQKLLSVAFILALASGFALGPTNAREPEMNNAMQSAANWNFGQLPKVVPVPPTGPNPRINEPPPAPKEVDHNKKWNFGKLPKAVPIPPAGPNPRIDNPPPAPTDVGVYSQVHNRKWNFGKLPKGVPIPPSGPSPRTNDTPPPPGKLA